MLVHVFIYAAFKPQFVCVCVVAFGSICRSAFFHVLTVIVPLSLSAFKSPPPPSPSSGGNSSRSGGGFRGRRFAFCHIAAYGRSYTQSARQSYELLETSGVQAVVEDDVSAVISTMACETAGALSAVIYGKIYDSIRHTAQNDTQMIIVY